MHPVTISQQRLFDGTVEARQQLAEELHQKYGAEILRDENLQADLELLKEHALLLGSKMAELGMGEHCSRCAAGPGGGCCSLYMAGETDAVQMLMNMLAGIQVRQVRNDGVECCYLGDRGCLFIIKPVFCLNYICKTILDFLSVEDAGELERCSGRLLNKQFEMEQRIIRFVRTQASAS